MITYLNNALYSTLSAELLNNTDIITTFVNLLSNNNLTTNSDIINKLDDKWVNEFYTMISTLKRSDIMNSLKFSPSDELKSKSDKINSILNELSTYINSNLLSADKANIIQQMFIILIKINGVEDITLQLTLVSDISEKDSVDINVNEFITAYNNLGKELNILKLLTFYQKYNLIHLLHLDKDFNELNVIKILYDKVFNNPLFINISEYINLKNNLSIYVDDKSKYNDIYKTALTQFGNNTELTNLSALSYNVLEFEKLNIYGKIDYSNLFKFLSETIELPNDIISTFDNMGILKPDKKTLYNYIDIISSLNLSEIYENNQLNINEITNILYGNNSIILNIFKNINEVSVMVNALNSSILNTPVLEILLTIHKNKTDFTNINASDDKAKTIEEFNKQCQEEFEKYAGNDIYKEGMNTDKNSINKVICNILKDDNTLNTEYLQNVFKNYTDIVTKIINNLLNTKLYTIYEGVLELIKIKSLSKLKNESFIMYKNTSMNYLFETEENTELEQSQNNKDITTFSQGLNTIIKFAKEHNITDDLPKACQEYLKSIGVETLVTDTDNTNLTQTSEETIDTIKQSALLAKDKAEDKIENEIQQ